MAESSAYARRGFSGAAVETELSAGISAAATTIACSDLSTWTAADDNGPGRATLTDGSAEEEIEFTAVSSNNLTGCTRGVGGTTARAWDAGTTIFHGASVRDFDEANRVANLVLGVGSVVAGDLLYVSAASGGVPTTLSRLAKGTAGQRLTMNSGATAPEWEGAVGVRAVRTTTQSINSASYTAVQFNATDGYDTDSMHDPSSNNTRITIPTGRGGLYLINFAGMWASNASGARVAKIRKNGTTDLVIDEDIPLAAAHPIRITAIENLAAADYIEVLVYQSSGGALNIGDNGGNTNGLRFEASWLGAA